MNRSTSFVLTGLFIAMGRAFAQEPVSTSEPPYFTVRKVHSDSERAGLWEDRTADPSGYHRYSGSPSQVDIPRAMSRLRIVVPLQPPDLGCAPVNGISFTSVAREGRHRDSFLFRRGDLLGMVTKTNLRRTDITPHFIDEFLNAFVNGNRANLTLVDARRAVGLWRVTWVAGENLYEFYMQDALDAKRIPATTAARTIEIASAIACRP